MQKAPRTWFKIWPSQPVILLSLSLSLASKVFFLFWQKVERFGSKIQVLFIFCFFVWFSLLNKSNAFRFLMRLVGRSSQTSPWCTFLRSELWKTIPIEELCGPEQTWQEPLNGILSQQPGDLNPRRSVFGAAGQPSQVSLCRGKRDTCLATAGVKLEPNWSPKVNF